MAQQFELPNAEEFLAPLKALNELAIANTEKLVALQSKNFEKYSKIALNSLQEASQIADMEQSQEYFKKQGEVSKQVAEDLAADAKAVAELGQSYAEEVQKMVSENVAKAGQKVA